MAQCPTYNVYIDWNNDGDFGDANENVSAYVKSATISLGRSTDFRRFVVGTCELTLKNTDGRFSPENGSSPLSGSLLLNRPIKFDAVWSGSTFTLFYGYISRYTPRPDKMAQECYIRAEDPLARMKRESVITPLWEGATIEALAGSLLDFVSMPSANRAIDAVADTVAYAAWRDTPLATALEQLTEACGGHHYIEPDQDNDYIYRFESRYHWQSGSAHTTAVETWDDTIAGIDYDLSDDELFNQIIVQSHVQSAGAEQNLWQLESVPTYFAAGESLTFWANFSEYVTGLVDPVATTDYTANSSSDGTGTDKTANFTVVMTAYGLAAKLVVTNTDGAGNWLTALRVRGVRIQEVSATADITEDATSQATYFVRGLTIDNRFVDDVGTARGLGSYYLYWYKDPRAKVSRVTRINQFPSQIQRKIGDRVTLVHSGLGMNKDFHLNSIVHKIDLAGLRHITEYGAQDAGPGTGHWFQLDRAVADGGAGLDIGALIY